MNLLVNLWMPPTERSASSRKLGLFFDFSLFYLDSFSSFLFSFSRLTLIRDFSSLRIFLLTTLRWVAVFLRREFSFLASGSAISWREPVGLFLSVLCQVDPSASIR